MCISLQLHIPIIHAHVHKGAGIEQLKELTLNYTLSQIIMYMYMLYRYGTHPMVFI